MTPYRLLRGNPETLHFFGEGFFRDKDFFRLLKSKYLQDLQDGLSPVVRVITQLIGVKNPVTHACIRPCKGGHNSIYNDRRKDPSCRWFKSDMKQKTTATHEIGRAHV